MPEGGTPEEGDRPAGGRLIRAVDRLADWAAGRMGTRAGYTLVFFLLFSLTWAPIVVCCLAAGKSFIWSVDGLSQQYAWFVYGGEWIRQALHTVFVDHSFDLPMWTMGSGYGTDVVETYLSMLANPFMWLSAPVPAFLAEYMLELACLAQLYLAGLAFSAWVRGHGASRANAMVGALCYVFAANVMVVFSQSTFALILLAAPLVLIGADRVFDRRGAGLFVASLSWLLLYSFYDAYMLLVLLLIYCVAQFFARVDKGRPRKGRWARLLGWAGLFLGLVAVCVLVSAVLVLPQVLSLLGDGRLGVQRSDAPLYELGFYLNVLLGVVSFYEMPADAIFGVGPVALLCAAVLVMRRRQGRGRAALLAVLLILFAMLLLPVAGRLMNGMQYPANRWVWGFDLCLSFMVATMLPDLLSAGRRERRVLVVLVVVYGLAILFLPLPGRGPSFMVGYALLLATLALVCAARSWGRRRLMVAVTALVMLSGAATFVTYLSPYYYGKLSSQMGVAKSYRFHYTLGPQALIDQVGDYDDTYRYDRSTYVAGGVHNSGLITGHMTPDYYNSFYNQYVDDFNESLGLADTEGINFRYGALNGRAELEALLGVKYYYLPTGSSLLPVSFILAGREAASGIGADGAARSLYETDVVAPLAFVSDSVMSAGDYGSLNMVDRGYALLDAVVVDDPDDLSGTSRVGVDDLSATSRDVGFTVQTGEGVTQEGDSFVVTGSGATVTLTFDSPGDAETYLCVEGLTYRDLDYRDRYDDQGWEALGWILRNKILAAQPFQEHNTNGVVSVINQSGDLAAKIYQMNPQDHMYGDKHDWAVNLGYSQDGTTTLTLRFEQVGTYTFSNMEVRPLSMDGLEGDVDRLKDAGASDIELGTNRISCSAAADQDGSLLFLSVAYSDGWSAQVDGRPARIVRADLGFMAVELPAGEHRVVLTYATPYLGAGAVASAVGVALAVAACLVLSRRRRAGAGCAAGSPMPAHYE